MISYRALISLATFQTIVFFYAAHFFMFLNILEEYFSFATAFYLPINAIILYMSEELRNFQNLITLAIWAFEPCIVIQGL
jgi:hypothetical protein